MVPESSEGRERITRLEERVDSNRRQIEMLGPLPLQVGLVQRGQEELRDDLAQLRRDMEVRFDRDGRERRDWEERFERSVGNQFATCSGEIAKVAGRFDKWVADEERRRREDTQAEAQSATERFVAKYGLRATIGAAVIAAIASVANNFIG